MSRPRILYVCHNHPSVRPGGAEAYALEVYEAMKQQGEFEPIFLAKGGPPMSAIEPHSGTPFGSVNGDKHQYFFFTEHSEFAALFGTLMDKTAYTKHFQEFLTVHQPDVIHFQHTHFLGYDLIRQVRNTLPGVPIVYTLHEFLPICHRSGQMIRTGTEELCTHASPRRCHECFPHISPENFYLRQRFIQSHLSLVDVFLAPSRFLMQRYIEWGIPPSKIRFEDYGRGEVERIHSEPRVKRNRIGFFGQFTGFKGADVLLRAMKILGDAGADVHLWLHGANLELQPGTYQNLFRELLEETSDNVTMVGRYHHSELPSLMEAVDWIVVPSIWWENSPLVIQEAFIHGRPVICSDIGGMAEKVDHNVNGLHFRVSDPVRLAYALTRATTEPGLWEKLRSGIPPIYRMNEHVMTLTKLYQELIDLRREAPVGKS